LRTSRNRPEAYDATYYALAATKDASSTSTTIALAVEAVCGYTTPFNTKRRGNGPFVGPTGSAIA
jgi:hypothetical protein